MRRPKFLAVLILLSFALIMTMATGCEKNPQLIKLKVTIEGNGVVRQTYTPKASAGYVKDSLVMLTAQPDKGWKFSHWEGDLTGSANPKEIAITEPTDITAVFLPTLKVAWCYVRHESFMPSDALLAEYSLDLLEEPASIPTDYDVLVIDELDALNFSVTDFTGKVIITIDSGIENFLDQMLGMGDGESFYSYWDYESLSELQWSSPVSGVEVGSDGDARVYHILDDIPEFTRKATILQAGSTDDADDIILYEIATDSGSLDWLHIGPHFGDYEDAVLAQNRSSAIIDYVLKLLNGKNPEFPPLPETEP